MKKLRKLEDVKLSDGSLLSEAIDERNTSPHPNKLLKFKNEDFSYIDFSKQQLKYLHFKDCNFSHCDFTESNISFTRFIQSDLTKANFTKARLYYNYFYKSNLTDVNFEDVTISGYGIYHLLKNNSNLTNVKLEQLTGSSKIPFVEDLHKKVYKSVGDEGRFLEMSDWHRYCGTTHCRGGWAIHHAGEVGYKLETKLGSGTAAALIYQKSTGMIPKFYGSNEQALKDIKRCAKLYL